MRWRTTLSAIFLLLGSTPLWAQITVPATTPAGTVLVASVNASSVPENATFDGGWSILPEGNATADFRTLSEPNSIGIWSAGGKFTLRYSGFWLLLGPEISVKDEVTGEIVKIKPYLGHGFVNEEAKFEVTGGAGPDPPQPPPPGGPYQIVMFYSADQLDNLPSAQRALLTSLTVRKQLQAAGHIVLEILEASDLSGVSGELQKFVNASKDIPLPVLAYAPRSGGDITAIPLPADSKALMEVLK